MGPATFLDRVPCGALLAVLLRSVWVFCQLVHPEVTDRRDAHRRVVTLRSEVALLLDIPRRVGHDSLISTGARMGRVPADITSFLCIHPSNADRPRPPPYGRAARRRAPPRSWARSTECR